MSVAALVYASSVGIPFDGSSYEGATFRKACQLICVLYVCLLLSDTCFSESVFQLYVVK